MTPEMIAQLEANAPRPTAPTKKKGRGSFLSSLISELGGAGGAAGGAAIGTALLPGIGTVLGGIAGGFLGGTGGRLAENKVRDDEFRVKQAVGEGLLSGALSGVGGALQVGKAAKGLKAVGASKGLASALKNPAAMKLALKNPKALKALAKSGVQVSSLDDLVKPVISKVDDVAKVAPKASGSKGWADAIMKRNQPSLDALAKETARSDRIVKAMETGGDVVKAGAVSTPKASAPAKTIAQLAGGRTQNATQKAIESAINSGNIDEATKLAGAIKNPATRSGILSTIKQSVPGSSALDDFSKALSGGGSTSVLKTSSTGKLSKLSDKALASQYGTISKPTARANDPLGTVRKLSELGITKPQDAERIARSVTGADGIINSAVTSAVGKSGKITTQGMDDVLKSAAQTSGLVDKDLSSVSQVVQAQLKSIDADGGKPDTVLKVMRQLEKRIANLQGKGGNYRLTTPERVDQANVLKAVKSELENRLFNVAGANKNVAGAITPAIKSQLLQLSPGNAKWAKYVDDLAKVQDIQSLRSAQSPFVKIMNIIDEGDLNSMTFGGRVGNLANRGGLMSRVLDTTGDMVKSPVARSGATVLDDLAKVTSVAGSPQVSRASGLLKSVLGRGVVNQMNAPVQQEPVEDPFMLEQGGMVDPQAATDWNLPAGVPQVDPGGGFNSTSFTSPGGQVLGASTDQNSPENVQQQFQAAAMRALQAGDIKAMQEILQTAKMFQEFSEFGQPAASKPMSAAAAESLAGANAGLDSINLLREEMTADPSVRQKTVLPGRGIIGGLGNSLLGTSNYQAAFGNILDSWARVKTGAAISNTEERRFNANLPSPFDPPDTVEKKLRIIEDLFNTVASRTGTAGTDTEAAVQRTYNL